jgi:hypothetical protein
MFFVGSVLTLFMMSPIIATGVKINDIQMLSSHNSYKKNISPVIWCLSNKLALQTFARELHYEHRPLPQEADLGVRHFELDIHYDPGDRMLEFKFLRMAQHLLHRPKNATYLDVYDGPSRGNTTLIEQKWKKPSFKTMHDPNVDFLSTCSLFTECLQQLKDWSDAHPRHLPITIQLELVAEFGAEVTFVNKDILKILNFMEPIPATTSMLEFLEQEITSVIPQPKLFVPDDLRGGYRTLREAVAANAWPDIETMRGRFIMVLSPSRAQAELYLRDHPSLRGRKMFLTTGGMGADHAAFIKIDESEGREDYLRSLVANHYMVRTRADEAGKQAFENNVTRRESALASASHFVSTDYPAPDPVRTGTPYYVSIPGGNPARCNPAFTSTPCNSSDISE